MKTITLKAEQRKLTGRKVKRLRKDGILPANIFGKNEKSQSLQVDLKQFEQVFKQAGETNLVELMVGSKKTPTLIHNIQTDPVSDIPLHVDFLQVNLKEKVTANVPVELTGEVELVKSGAAIINQTLHEIEVEALPTDIPENITFDISGLTEIGAMLKVSDAKVPSSVEVKTDPEIIVVSVSEPQKEEEVAPPVEEAAAEGEPTKVAGEEAVTGVEEKSAEAEAPKAE